MARNLADRFPGRSSSISVGSDRIANRPASRRHPGCCTARALTGSFNRPAGPAHGQPGLHRRCSGPPVGCSRHPHPLRRGRVLARRGPRCLLQPHRRVAPLEPLRHRLHPSTRSSTRCSFVTQTVRSSTILARIKIARLCASDSDLQSGEHSHRWAPSVISATARRILLHAQHRACLSEVVADS